MAVKTYRIPETLKKVSLLDLTADQVEDIEAEVGWPVNQWGTRGSLVKVLRLVLAAGNGVDPDALKGKTMAEIKALVSIEGADDATADDDPDR
jgi:hypothetical protein